MKWMKRTGTLCCLAMTIVSVLSVMAVGVSAFAEGVEIEFEGLSPAAIGAMENMAEERKQVTSRLNEPMARLKKLMETYKHSCGMGKPTDSGCQETFNQIIDAHKEVMKKVGKFLDFYNSQLKIVVSELEPQIEGIAYNNTPSDIIEDLMGKYENNAEGFEDGFADAIQKSFGLGDGQTAFEMASASYMQYTSEYNQYRRLGKMLQSKIMEAERMKSLGTILNTETQKELKSITSWIYGNKKREADTTVRTSRTSVLR